MKKMLLLASVLLLSLSAWSMDQETSIYLFHGQGADKRQFRDLEFPPGYDTICISLPTPEHREEMTSYARRFLPYIDTCRPVILIGVSLGGMICTELADHVPAQTIILISSAKTFSELPRLYNFQKKLPLNRLIPKRLTKAGARLLQGVFEPDRRYDKACFKDMLKNKDATYMKRTVDMIVNWERESYDEGIIHIHGDADHTIPYRNVSCTYTIKDGSHLMVLTRAKEINMILAKELSSSGD